MRCGKFVLMGFREDASQENQIIFRFDKKSEKKMNIKITSSFYTLNFSGKLLFLYWKLHFVYRVYTQSLWELIVQNNCFERKKKNAEWCEVFYGFVPLNNYLFRKIFPFKWKMWKIKITTTKRKKKCVCAPIQYASQLNIWTFDIQRHNFM